MKIIKKNRFIYFKDFNKEDIEFLTDLLSFNERVWSKYSKNKYKKHIFLFTDKQRNVYTWAGYLDYIKENYEEYFEKKINVIDESNKVVVDLSEEDINKIKHLPNITLRDYQVLAVIRAVKSQFGVIKSATSSGKTVMIASLINFLNLPSLVIVPTIQLAEQLCQAFLDYGLNKNDVSIMTKTSRLNKINIAVVNTVFNRVKQDDQSLKEIKVLVVDEFQHFQSSMYREIDKYLIDTVTYSIGFTGSIFRYSEEIEKKKSLEDFIMLGLIGKKPLINIDYKFLLENKYISEPHIFIETINYPQVYYQDWHKVLKNLIVENEYRNERIAYWMQKFYSYGFSILTLADRVEHIKNIFSMIEDENLKRDTIILLGNKKAMIYEWGDLRQINIDYNDVLERVRNKEIRNLIASPVAKEGMDIPSMDSVILAYAGKSEVAILQKLGRGLRRTETKDKVFIVDFYDNTHKFLQNHSRNRIRIYKQQKFPLYYSINNDEKKFEQVIEDSLVVDF